MEQSMVHGLKFAPSQHCSSADFNPSDLIQTAIFNLFVMVLFKRAQGLSGIAARVLTPNL